MYATTFALAIAVAMAPLALAEPSAAPTETTISTIHTPFTPAGNSEPVSSTGSAVSATESSILTGSITPTATSSQPLTTNTSVPQQSSEPDDGAVYVTQTVTSYTTYCPSPTTFTQNSKTYTVTTATTLTITDCPCTIVTSMSVFHGAAAATPAPRVGMVAAGALGIAAALL